MRNHVRSIREEKSSPENHQGRIDEYLAFGKLSDNAPSGVAGQIEAVAVARIRAKEIGHGFNVLQTVDPVCNGLIDPVPAQVGGDDQPMLVPFLDDPAGYLGRTPGVYFEGLNAPASHVLNKSRDLFRIGQRPPDIGMDRRV